MNKTAKHIPHNTCPRCLSTDTFWNESSTDPDNSSSHFMMYCENCKKYYTSVHKPDYVMWNAEEDY